MDFKNKKISIVGTYNKYYYLDKYKNNPDAKVLPPKTKRSIRSVHMTQDLIKIFEDLYRTTKFNGRNDFVFVGETGNITNDHAIRRALNRVRKACEFEESFTYHSLRHTFATEMFRKKVDVQIVSRILGHKDVATTRRIYIHVSTEMEQEALDAVFGKA